MEPRCQSRLIQPFPPPADRLWTNAQKQHLLQLLRAHWSKLPDAGDISDRDLRSLVDKLSTPKAVRRFEHVARYVAEHEQRPLSYTEWLDRILQGFVDFNTTFLAVHATPEGDRSQLYEHLLAIAGQSYRKLTGRSATVEQCEDLASLLLLSLIEDYYYDVSLDRWLWRTARYLVLSELRDHNNDPSASLDTIAMPDKTPDPVEWYLAHDAIRRAIRKVPNQSYRVVLLLLYLYQMDNSELAAFFGVPIPRVTTWLSRARAALRQTYQDE